MTAACQPAIWLLTGARHGDNAQLRALAADLDLPVREVPLAQNALCQLPNGLLGATLASLKARPEALVPPWPCLVIGIGRRSVPAARWISASSGGQARLVWLGRPRTGLGHFDLVLTTPQYAMPEAPNVVRLSLPWQAPMSEPPAHSAAHVLAILGGPSWSAAPSAATVDALAASGRQRAEALGLPLVATTGPRTPGTLADRLRQRLGPRATLHDWRQARGAVNPYREWLASAAEIVLSGDSVSALADAAWTNRPVTVVDAPAPRWLRAVDRLGSSAARWRRSGGNLALGAPPPNLDAIRETLATRGLALHEGPGAWRLTPCRAALEAERRAALERLRALLAPASGRL